MWCAPTRKAKTISNRICDSPSVDERHLSQDFANIVECYWMNKNPWIMQFYQSQQCQRPPLTCARMNWLMNSWWNPTESRHLVINFNHLFSGASGNFQKGVLVLPFKQKQVPNSKQMSTQKYSLCLKSEYTIVCVILQSNTSVKTKKHYF